MNTEQNVQTIELDIDTARAQVAMKNDVEKLYRNPIFKRVILNHYFEQEPVRICMMKAAPSQQGEKEQKELMKMLDGIGALDLYLRSRMMIGMNAETAINAMEDERDMMQAEDLIDA